MVTDTYDFPTMIRNGNVYVDKTMYLHRLVSKVVGAVIRSEVESASGRADAVIETDGAVYIFEFKYGKTARLALKQITAKGYAKPYASDTRKVVLVGVNYNPRTGAVELLDGPVNSKGGTVNGTVNPDAGTVKSMLLLTAIRNNPGVRRPKLQALTGWSPRTLARYIEQLAGQIEFRGAPKTGGYYLTTAI